MIERENHPEIKFGSKKFVDYACGVASEDIDPELKKLPDYEDIVFYCAQYLHELDEYQAEGKKLFLLLALDLPRSLDQ